MRELELLGLAMEFVRCDPNRCRGNIFHHGMFSNRYYKDQVSEQPKVVGPCPDMDENREKDNVVEDPPQIIKDLEARHQLELRAVELQDFSHRDRDSGQGESSPSRSSTISSPSSALSGSLARLRVCDATHRGKARAFDHHNGFYVYLSFPEVTFHTSCVSGIHRFVPRHPDEVAVDLGDPVYVIR